MSWPVVRFRERSWDFMPPDVVRHFASTTVSEIAIIARRLGMMWKEFRPTEGIMEAEGSSQGLSATIVRGIGIMLQYRNMSASKNKSIFGHACHSTPEACVCTTEADRMWFGILPGNPGLDLPDFDIGTEDKIYATVYSIDETKKAENALRNVLQHNY